MTEEAAEGFSKKEVMSETSLVTPFPSQKNLYFCYIFLAAMWSKMLKCAKEKE